MQSKNQRNFTSADVVEAINQSDIAWFQNLNPIISTKTTQNYNFEALNNIESQTIERYLKMSVSSGIFLSIKLDLPIKMVLRNL